MLRLEGVNSLVMRSLIQIDATRAGDTLNLFMLETLST